ncbi:tyrosine-type recombinase/integrase [Rubrivirga litoralis]|uniref:Tyrosine-type recombinase/integrase n=1 Tax=Rubrivirga litoralis TaxID=3075598 RepID=A0ABU3BS10_9BACT|nr:tyrosine-type recombinase/integrase [Rubrivirga sp. F394]MDT0631971.1 tyrosine-type recombinase/integrase [Rubrivirga sp. F394]
MGESEIGVSEIAITAIQRVEPLAVAVRQSVMAPPVSQADDDKHLVRLWLHGKSANTRDAYERDVCAFVDFADVPLQRLTLDHLQAWSDALLRAGLAASTRSRKLSAVKSLLSFGHRLGYLIYNVGAAVALPKQKDTLAERILPEAAVHRVLAVADATAEGGSFVQRRNALALRLFYASGGRVSELAGLRWRDCVERSLERGRPTGQVTLYGKGGKTRRVLLSADTWTVLDGHRQREMIGGHAEGGHPVLRSRKAGADGEPRPLTRQQLWRVVKHLAKRAGLPDAVSPHFFRHAHASHALDRGAPPHLVQQTLGHASLQTTSRYAHARPDDSSARYLGV